VWDDDAVHCSL
jgi:hypothetical protein